MKDYLKNHKLPIGSRFGRLTTIDNPYWQSRKAWRATVQCRCNCGRIVTIHCANLRSGNTKSCGCIVKIHGDSKTPLFRVWIDMQDRCQNINHHAFDRYGGRGIKVCSSWKKFVAFKRWAVSNGYHQGLSLDRKNNDQGYRPSNCRWATDSQQNLNRRKQTKPSTSRYVGVSYCRFRRKWRARIRVRGTEYLLGQSFANETAAYRARRLAEKKLKVKE